MCAALGLALGNFPFLLAALVLVAGALAHRVAPPPVVAFERRLGAKETRAGDVLRVGARLTWPKSAGALVVHEKLPDSFRLREGTNFHAFPLDAGEAELAFQATTGRRGLQRIGAAEATIPDPLGASAARLTTLAPEAEVAVQAAAPAPPKVRTPAAWGVTAAPGGDRAARGATTNDFRELRPYAFGDPLKSVNWKATARASVDEIELVVNEYEVEGKKAVWVFLDSSPYTAGGSTVQTRFDELALGALAVARHYLSRGHRVGLTLYGGPECTVLHPDAGTTQERRIVNLLTFADTAREHGTNLAAAVGRTRGFLARERPVVFAFTLVGRDESLEKGVTDARALASSGRRAGMVAVLAPAPKAADGVPGRIVALRERIHLDALRAKGVHVGLWEDPRRPLSALLAQGVVR